jgi:hypothetical protein
MTTDEPIFERVARTYASCRSYQDEGAVVTTIISELVAPWGRRTSRKPFRTAFVRPDRLRFEFSEEAEGPESEWKRYVVWADGKDIRSWWTVRPRIEHHETLLHALAGPTGVSNGSAGAVPSLLLSAPYGRLVFPPAQSPRLVGREPMKGSDCYRLEADTAGHAAQLWIDTAQFVIRQMREEGEIKSETKRPELAPSEIEAHFPEPRFTDADRARVLESLKAAASMPTPPARFEQWTYYRPELDVEIDSSTFEFEPPT